MQNRHRKLKLISVMSLTVFWILAAVMIVHIIIKYVQLSRSVYSSAPGFKTLLFGVLYLSFLAVALVIHVVFKKRLHREFPDKYFLKEKLIKNYLIRRSIKAIAIACIICAVLLIITPFIAIPVFVNRHVDYKGFTTYDYPLQDIYEAVDYGLKENQMYLKTEDGYNIWCSEINTKQPKAVIIYLTGIVQPSVTYFYGHAKHMQLNGYASILLEVRGHGKSDGSRIGLGYEETSDVKAVVEYIKNEKKYNGVPIILHGVSMGGAISVNAFGQLEEIDGLIAMSAYSSFDDIIMDVLDGYGVPKFIQAMEKPLIHLALEMVFGSDTVRKIKPAEQIKCAGNRPVFLIACTGDTEVPKVNTKRLHEANPNVQTWFRDSWEHFIIKNCDFKNVGKDKEYWNNILKFIEDKVVYD